MQPEKLDAWVSIFRDVIIVFLGAFLMVFAVVAIHEPVALGTVLGAGLTALGVPPWLRVREAVKAPKGVEEEDPDKWSHLP